VVLNRLRGRKLDTDTMSWVALAPVAVFSACGLFEPFSSGRFQANAQIPENTYQEMRWADDRSTCGRGAATRARCGLSPNQPNGLFISGRGFNGGGVEDRRLWPAPWTPIF